MTATTAAKTESPSSTLEREATGGHTIRERTQSLTEQMVCVCVYVLCMRVYCTVYVRVCVVCLCVCVCVCRCACVGVCVRTCVCVGICGWACVCVCACVRLHILKYMRLQFVCLMLTCDGYTINRQTDQYNNSYDSNDSY